MKAIHVVERLRRRALTHPETAEGVACAGTSLESRTVTVRGKAFLFVRGTELRLKLRDALATAQEVATRAPARCQAAPGGWVKLLLADDAHPDADVLLAWVDESYGLFAPKRRESAGPSSPQRSAPSPAQRGKPAERKPARRRGDAD